MANLSIQVHDDTMVRSMKLLVSSRLLGGTCVCLEQGLECAMDRHMDED